ncbi:PAS domain S-box-containing protein [Chryseobacterium formosense]|uniref:ATP-binding protein n=1 Tax=Chryseobacterium formosense TaxID=236814 RepID=UPI000690712D|nr:ATP-binding protein [Chryseobacterium formosense]SFT45789.1 PAS domain S-box-containing protein [Chryseobacterium formosense]
MADINSLDEQLRLQSLRSYQILDSAEEKNFDDLTELAASICNTPIALISFVDADRQWFKSHYGLDTRQTDRCHSFCSHAIEHPDILMQVEDALADPRFRDNALVTGSPDIRFYAGMPLVDEQGYALGSICVIDHQPRKLNDAQQKALRTLARQVIDKLSLKKRVHELELAQKVNLILKENNRKSESSFKNVIEQSPAAIILFRGPDLVIDTANAPMLELLDKNSDIIGLPLLTAIPELEGQSAYNLLYDIYHSGKPVYGNETPVELKRNGQIKTAYFNFTYTPLYEDGKIVGIIDMAVEVTDQVRSKLALQQNEYELKRRNQELITSNEDLVQANKRLREAEDKLKKSNIELFQSRDRLQTILDTVGEGIGITDENGNIVYTNKQNREIFKVDELSMLTLKNSSPQWNNRKLDGTPLPDDEHPIIVAIRTGKPVENYVFLVDNLLGDSLYLRMNSTPLKDHDGNIIGAIGSFADITESYLLHQEVMDKEEYLSMAISSANLGTWRINAKTREFTASARLKEIFGFSADEEMQYDATVNQIEDSHRQKVVEAIDAAINKGVPYELEYPINCLPDKKLRWVYATGKLYLNSVNPGISHFSGTIADITERKLDEQRRSDFIGMVSHELRNPLTAIRGYTYILGKRADKNNDHLLSETASKLTRQTKRMDAMINGFLETARLGEGKIQLNKTKFDIADLVRIAEEESLATITSHKIIFAPVEFTAVEADRDKIEQVLLNFINNAVKYSQYDTVINIACVTENNLAYVCVTDQGMGIPQKDQPYIFDRFYRVESEEMKHKKGFGIGLYICKEIIERHAGQIGVKSKEGHGSTFWFTLPITS